jgi:hypothetical protein
VTGAGAVVNRVRQDVGQRRTPLLHDLIADELALATKKPGYIRVGCERTAGAKFLWADSSERRNTEAIRRLRWELCGRADVA